MSSGEVTVSRHHHGRAWPAWSGHSRLCSDYGPSRNKQIIWRTERDHLLSSPRKRGPRSNWVPAFAGMTTEGVALPSIDAVVSSQALSRTARCVPTLGAGHDPGEVRAVGKSILSTIDMGLSAVMVGLRSARRMRRLRLFPQEHIVGGVGLRTKSAGLPALSFRVPARGVDALYRRHVLQRTAAAPVRHVQLQPGNVLGTGARSTPDRFADHGAAADLPRRTRVVPADGHAIEKQRGDRLAKLPGQLLPSSDLHS